MRNEGLQIGKSFQEQLNIAAKSGVHLHISHLKAWGKANWYRIDDILSKAEAYVSQGGQLSWDRYPYLAASTLLGIILPAWVWQAGTESLIRNLTQKDFREQIRLAFKKRPDEWDRDPGSVGWDNLLISGVVREENRWMQGMRVTEIAREQKIDEVDVVCDLLSMEELAVTAIFFFGDEGVLEKVLTHPFGCVGSDGIHLGQPHPRLFGSMPRFIQQFGLERRTLPLQEVIRKVTSFPADILGLDKRGRLKTGWHADVVVFDPETLDASFDYRTAPKHPQGIVHVFVNGQWVLRDGIFNGDLAGKVLRKGF